MDVELLSKMIKELILDKDRVVLPGLGCFVAEMVPSTFSDKGYTINPPYRKLSFRSRPDSGDDLIDFYVEKNGLERDVACRILGDFIGDLRQVIFTKKVVVLPGLGRLRATKENNLFFIPDEDLDIFPAGTGLEPISLKTQVETQQEVAAALSGLKSIMEEVVVSDQSSSAEMLSSYPDSSAVETASVEETTAPVEGVEAFEEQTNEPAVDEYVKNGPATAAEVAEEADIVAEVFVEKSVDEKPKRSAGKRFVISVTVIAAIALLLLGAYALTAYLIPGVFDTILYTPEELEILNRKI